MTQQFPQYPPPYQQPAGHLAPPAPPQNGFGTAGFVLGLVGLLFSFIPLVGVIAWPLVILGLIFAGVGLARARAGRATNKGLAIAGLACSALGLLVCILYASAFASAVSSSTTDADAPGTTLATGSGDAQATAGLGQEVRDGSFAFTVTKVEPGVKTLGDGFLKSTAQGHYVLVHLTVTNIGKDAQMFSGGNQKLLDAQGREFDADTGAAVMNLPDSQSFLNNINPGNSVNGTVVFDMPTDVAPAAIELHDSAFSGGATVALTG
ncbi:DUF4352 domain-containing protein [Pseudonocardia asaccharolytica]|uniref:DUF4352 domain-containing protein n=1 Tax=Pseudonocardia asaccharolytica DSM 44247 = NBRC 16224 TaxID=1123024 RepID=A0A511D0T1_9PSEU|nr:DUF4352 domain-containing protein [Pseudonocardia asaccharolytica]GEL18376.1 hypothetical protein PA7_22130 [Pseudonocardia asaccharolytica DSM 44247 = NBRC 16224]